MGGSTVSQTLPPSVSLQIKLPEVAYPWNKRYVQQSKTTTFLKNDMREGSGPCRKQAISSRGTQNDGCESNQVIVSCNLAVAITAEPPLHLECKCVCRENGYKRHGQQIRLISDIHMMILSLCFAGGIVPCFSDLTVNSWHPLAQTLINLPISKIFARSFFDVSCLSDCSREIKCAKIQ